MLFSVVIAVRNEKKIIETNRFTVLSPNLAERLRLSES